MSTLTRDATIHEHAALAPEIRALITLARWDLIYGPPTDADGTEDIALVSYPGFEKACARIREALPTGDLWFDQQSGTVQDTEPEWSIECQECDGDGCEDCDGDLHGVGRVTVNYPEDWIELDARAVKVALVGKELAEYV